MSEAQETGPATEVAERYVRTWTVAAWPPRPEQSPEPLSEDETSAHYLTLRDTYTGRTAERVALHWEVDMGLTCDLDLIELLFSIMQDELDEAARAEAWRARGAIVGRAHVGGVAA